MRGVFLASYVNLLTLINRNEREGPAFGPHADFQLLFHRPDRRHEADRDGTGDARGSLECATFIAREMFTRLPDLSNKGTCVTVCDERGETASIVPLDPMS